MWRFFKPTLLRLVARGDVENLVLILVRYGHPISYEQLEAIAEMPDVAEKVVSRLTYRYRDNPEYHESALPLIATLCLLPNTVERAISAILDDSSWLKRIEIDTVVTLISSTAAKRPDALSAHLRYGNHLHIDLQANLLADALRRMGEPWATEGILWFFLSYKMGESWRARHNALLDMITDRERALQLLLQVFVEHPTIESGRDLGMVPYCFSRLAGLKWAVWYSDYDVNDRENHSMYGQLMSELQSQKKATQQFFERMHRAAVEGRFGKGESISKVAATILSQSGST